MVVLRVSKSTCERDLVSETKLSNHLIGSKMTSAIQLADGRALFSRLKTYASLKSQFENCEAKIEV